MFEPMEDAMKPTTPLKLSAIAFVLLWSGWMIWLSLDPATLAITSACGLVWGYLWYRTMCWCFRIMRLLPDMSAGATS